jgi:hypothetical protein
VTGHLIFNASGGLAFVTPADPGYQNEVSGYQSTATVTVIAYDDGSSYHSLPVGATVLWSVKSVSNPSAVWWLRSATAKNGLTGGDNADGTGDWASDTVVGTPPTAATAQLTDIVGSRSVTLEASVCLGGHGGDSAVCSTNGGAWYADETTVSFGAGPLSVFTTNPNDGRGKAWATLRGTSVGTGNGNFTSTGNTFPAAGITHGSVRNDTVSTSGSTPDMTAAFGTGWTVGEMLNGHYSTTANLPRISQLLAVAKYDDHFHRDVPRRGAVFAAGWPDNAYKGRFYDYWSGEVFFLGDLGIFVSWGVSLGNGRYGWYFVDYIYHIAVGVLP